MGGFAGIFKGLIGGDPVKSIGDLIGQFHVSPEQKAQMQQAAQELELRRDEVTAARDEALAEIKEKNLESARAMQVAVKSWIPAILAVCITGGLFGLLMILAFHPVPGENSSVLYVMVGALGSGFAAVIGYYFGSSRTGDTITEHLAQIAKGTKGKD